MSKSHVGRTRTSATKRFRIGWKLLRFAAIVLPLATIIGFSIPAIAPPRSEALDAVIKQAGFDPVLPPNRLRTPGALYVVKDNVYEKVCDVDPTVLASKLQSSPTQDRKLKQLEQNGYSLTGDLWELLTVKLSGAGLRSIQMSLTHVMIQEIPYSDLFEIEDDLLSQKKCDEAVHRLLEAKMTVCPGYAALSATTRYRLEFGSAVDISAEDRIAALNAARQVIQESSGGQLRNEGDDEISGDGLFYGIQLSRRCITLDTATEPSTLH